MTRLQKHLVQDYERVARAIEYLQNHRDRFPRLQEVARAVHLSQYHFQRLFKRWAGISPKRFLQFLTVEHARKLLRYSRSLLDTSMEMGLSSSSRLHDLFVSVEAITPGEYKRKGRGVTIWYGVHPTPFGQCLLAVTERGLCRLKFLAGTGAAAEVRRLKAEWPEARVIENPRMTKPYALRIFTRNGESKRRPLPVVLKGTNFQLKVWEALMRIPEGTLASYEDLARMVGKPQATRAVAGAVAKNPVVFVIPCHRVIRKMGVFGDYQGGATRKKAILAWEAARKSA